jgi:hypothetical protein
MAEIDVSGNEFHDAVSLSSALISWSDWKTALASDLLFFSDGISAMLQHHQRSRSCHDNAHKLALRMSERIS